MLKGWHFLTCHDEAAKEWGALGSRVLILSAITYVFKINGRTVQGGRTGTGARQEGGTSEGGAVIVGKSQGVGANGQTVNGSATRGEPGQSEKKLKSSHPFIF